MIGFILVSRPVHPRGNSQILAIDFICRKACVGSRRFQLRVAWGPVSGISPVIRLPLCLHQRRGQRLFVELHRQGGLPLLLIDDAEVAGGVCIAPAAGLLVELHGALDVLPNAFSFVILLRKEPTSISVLWLQVECLSFLAGISLLYWIPVSGEDVLWGAATSMDAFSWPAT